MHQTGSQIEVNIMKKKSLLMMLLPTLLAAPLLAHAQTVVRETSDGRLMVIEYNGKPPHKRSFISPDDTEMFARYAPMVDQVLVASEPDTRAGVPGKNIHSSIRLERIPAADIAQFARFEESADYRQSRDGRRGPPGKSRPYSPR